MKSFDYTVAAKDLADAVGSGSLPVLATPALIAYMENAAMCVAEQHLPAGSTTVGLAITMEHLAACKEGEKVVVEVEMQSHEGRKMCFSLVARRMDGGILGKAKHERFIVDAQRFMDKLT